jgi:hypothetical protein
MKRIETNTGMLELVDVGMYNGFCSPDNLIDDWRLEEELEEGYFEEYNLKSIGDYWDKFDNSKYNAWILKEARSFIKNELLPEIQELKLGILDIEVVSIWSPKEYNFDTDRLILNLVVEDEFEEHLLEELHLLTEEQRVELSTYLKDNFTTVSGFVSFVPNTIEGIEDNISDGDEKAISVFLQWLLYDRLSIYNPGWINLKMDCWYTYIQEQFCDYYSFLTIKN